jgi:hypothetical protein
VEGGGEVEAEVDGVEDELMLALDYSPNRWDRLDATLLS